MDKCWEREESEEEETGRTFVDKSSPRPFQKTLTWKSFRSQQNYNAMQTLGVPKIKTPQIIAPLFHCPHNKCFPIKVFITRRDRHSLSRRVIKAKFFERVWENFCSQKFSHLPIFSSDYLQNCLTPTRTRFFSFLVFCVLFLNGCKTLDRLAVNSMTDLLEYQRHSFVREEDTELAKEAVASNLKMLDGLLLQDTDNSRLQLLGGEAFFSYAFGYVETNIKPQALSSERASKLYLRGLEAASKKIGGERLFFDKDLSAFEKECKGVSKKLLPHYFWSVLNFAAWVNLNKSDLKALQNMSKVEIVGKILIKKDPEYFYGGGHLLLAMYYAGKPAQLGGMMDLSRDHFEKCLKIHERRMLLALLFYAQYYTTATQDSKLFDALLSEIQAFDVNSFPEQRLSNQIAKEKALELLKKKEDLFLE